MLEIGDYVVSTHRDFYGETFVVSGFTTNLTGNPLVCVLRPGNKGRGTVFYPRELVTEDLFPFEESTMERSLSERNSPSRHF